MSKQRDITPLTRRLPPIPPGLDSRLSQYLQGVSRAVSAPSVQFVQAARIWRSTNQSLTANGVHIISFDTTTLDTAGFYTAGAPTKLTAPVSGFYICGASIETGGSIDGTFIRKNGTTYIAYTNRQDTGVSAGIRLDETDYIELVVDTDANARTATSITDYSPVLWLARVGDVPE